MRRYAIRDDQWTRIEPLLPGKPGDPGHTAKDNRLFIDAVLWIGRTGAPWRDLPERYGKWYSSGTPCLPASTAGRMRRNFCAKASGSAYLRLCKSPTWSG